MMLLLLLDFIMQGCSTVTIIELQLTEKFKGCKFCRKKTFLIFLIYFCIYNNSQFNISYRLNPLPSFRVEGEDSGER